MQSKPVFNNFAKFFVLQAVGEAMAFGFSIPVPSAVIAMLLLLFYLLGREGDVARMVASSSQFLAHLILLFLLAVMTAFSHTQGTGEKWVLIITAFVVSTLGSLILSYMFGRRSQK